VAAPRYRNVLVGVDFSPTSRQALAHAAELARNAEAALHLVHVVPKLRPSVPFSAPNRRRVAELQKEARREAQEHLDGLAARLRGVKTHTKVATGLPHEVLLAQARRAKADLLVVGAQGMNLAEALLIGSTAERVMRKAKIPVVLVPKARR
jgi:nucleotide-binding universal stress UspA family protein